jgi:Trk-type K+ transport system membrane component
MTLFVWPECSGQTNNVIAVASKRKVQEMQRHRIWAYLIVVFAIFWIIFAIVLILGNFPFIIITMALTTVAVLSALVVALAWAYNNDY